VLYEMVKGARPPQAVGCGSRRRRSWSASSRSVSRLSANFAINTLPTLRTDLERLRRGQGATAAPHAALGRLRARWVSIGAAAVVVTAVVAGRDL
jgi:hypothetical protein